MTQRARLFRERTLPLEVLDAASEAWLDRAELRASPVTLETRVVVPRVVSMVEEPSVFVETIGEVMVVSGTEVAPATPLMPETVLSPVMVLVTSPLVMTEVQVLVETALGSTSSSSDSETVVVEVVVKVDSPEVTVVTTAEVTALPP